MRPLASQAWPHGRAVSALLHEDSEHAAARAHDHIYLSKLPNAPRQS